LVVPGDRAHAGDPEYVEFSQECDAARAQMKDEIVQSLFNIAKDELHPQAVRAARELLQSLYGNEFNPARRIEQVAPVTDDVLDLSKIGTEELRAFHKTLRRIRDIDEPTKPAISLVDALAEKASRKA